MRPINTTDTDLLIYSDASQEGWGGTDDIETVGGRWSDNEMPGHIKVPELHAAKLHLWTLATTKSNILVRLLLDNTTAICYINNMGGSHSEICNNVTKQIWFWCIDRNIWLSAVHIPGKKNCFADFKSSNFQDNKEWSLKP